MIKNGNESTTHIIQVGREHQPFRGQTRRATNAPRQTRRDTGARLSGAFVARPDKRDSAFVARPNRGVTNLGSVRRSLGYSLVGFNG